MQPTFFRGTAEPFARELPVEQATDAIELLTQNTSNAEAVVRLRLRYKDLGPTGDATGYISLRTMNNIREIQPRPLLSGSKHALAVPGPGQFLVRIDFPHAFDVEEFLMFYRSTEELEPLSFSQLKYLSRNGSVKQFDLNGAECGIGRLIERLSTTVDNAAVAGPGVESPIIPALRKYENAVDREASLAELVPILRASLPLTTPAPLLLPLLDGIALRKHSAIVSDDVIELIAVIALCALKREGWLSTTGLESFKAWLTDIPTIERFMAKLNTIAQQHPGMPSEFVVAKHSINPAWLSIRRDAHLLCLDQTFAALKDFGINGVVCYGTLLGAVRDSKFIPHDDDVDVLYWDDSKSRQEAIDRRDELAFKLRERGFSVRIEPGLLHLNIGIDGGTCDLFPCWFEGDKVHLLMEKYQVRQIDKSILLPNNNSVISLYDRTFPAPAKIVAFLHERYGSGWVTPNKYFEWPWPLNGNQG